MMIVKIRTFILIFVLKYFFSILVSAEYSKAVSGKVVFAVIKIKPSKNSPFIQISGIDITSRSYRLFSWRSNKLVYTYGGLISLARVLKQHHLAFQHYDLASI